MSTPARTPSARRLNAYPPALAVRLACVAGLLGGCQLLEPEPLRKPAPGEITSSMHEMSVNVWGIVDILDTSETILPGERERIVGHLIEIERIADRLGADGVPTGHALIDADIARLKRDAGRARRAVEEEPPRYYLVGRLTGTCLACHERR